MCVFFLLLRMFIRSLESNGRDIFIEIFELSMQNCNTRICFSKIFEPKLTLICDCSVCAYDTINLSKRFLIEVWKNTQQICVHSEWGSSTASVLVRVNIHTYYISVKECARVRVCVGTILNYERFDVYEKNWIYFCHSHQPSAHKSTHWR